MVPKIKTFSDGNRLLRNNSRMSRNSLDSNFMMGSSVRGGGGGSDSLRSATVKRAPVNGSGAPRFYQVCRDGMNLIYMNPELNHANKHSHFIKTSDEGNPKTVLMSR